MINFEERCTSLKYGKPNYPGADPEGGAPGARPP